jgi:hypothetical protein
MTISENFETVIVVGPESELEARAKQRAARAVQVGQLDDNLQFRAYLQRTLKLLEDFDTTLDACLRSGSALEPVRQLFHEIFEKLSNVLDQIWFAVWEARIAPHVQWQDSKQAANARKHVHFPLVSAEAELTNALRGTHVATAALRDRELVEAVLAPQYFKCNDDFLSEVKRIAARKHVGVFSVASMGPQLSLAGKPAGTITFAKFKVEEWHGDEHLFRLTASGRYVALDGSVQPIPEDCLWLTYWGQLSVEGVQGDAARFVHGIFDLVIRVVRDFERLLRK